MGGSDEAVKADADEPIAAMTAARRILEIFILAQEILNKVGGSRTTSESRRTGRQLHSLFSAQGGWSEMFQDF